MGTITRIDYIIADGNVWTDDNGEYDSESSLGKLADQILAALREAYPRARVTVRRENAGGAVMAVQAESDGDYGIEPASDDQLEQIAAVADAVWSDDNWYVKVA